MDIYTSEVIDSYPAPLSPATPAESQLLDQDNPLPPATPNRVTEGLSCLQVGSPQLEAELPQDETDL